MDLSVVMELAGVEIGGEWRGGLVDDGEAAGEEPAVVGGVAQADEPGLALVGGDAAQASAVGAGARRRQRRRRGEEGEDGVEDAPDAVAVDAAEDLRRAVAATARPRHGEMGGKGR